MKIFFVGLWLVLLGCNNLFPRQAAPARASGFYFLRDFQYFKPLLADIRRPQFYTRVYYNHPVKFSNLNKNSGRHFFWDVGYGGYFPMVGYNFKNAGDRRGVVYGAFRAHVAGLQHAFG